MENTENCVNSSEKYSPSCNLSQLSKVLLFKIVYMVIWLSFVFVFLASFHSDSHYIYIFLLEQILGQYKIDEAIFCTCSHTIPTV